MVKRGEDTSLVHYLPIDIRTFFSGSHILARTTKRLTLAQFSPRLSGTPEFIPSRHIATTRLAPSRSALIGQAPFAEFLGKWRQPHRHGLGRGKLALQPLAFSDARL